MAEALTIDPAALPRAEAIMGAGIKRLSIDHANGGFLLDDLPIKILSKDVILLGLVRQRSYWDYETRTNYCGSLNHEHGRPTDNFDWDASNFEKAHYDKGDEQIILPCGNCSFKDWQADPTNPRKSKPGPCSEQFVVPLLVRESDDEPWRICFITFQRSSLKPITEHLKRFQKIPAPAYTRTTKLTLNVNLGSGGSYRYSVPNFVLGQEVESRAWPLLSGLLQASRVWLMTPRLPTRTRTGGMLSVSTSEPVNTGYSGSFFK